MALALGTLDAFGDLLALVGEEVGFIETDGFDEGFILGLILGCDDGFFEGLAEADGFILGCADGAPQSSAQKGPLSASTGVAVKVQFDPLKI